MIIPTITLEASLWQKGYINVVGVDEAGRGPLAGPVTAGAVMIHNQNQVINSVRDSKLMNPAQREKAFTGICTMSSAFGVGIVSNVEIDKIGIEKAINKAMYMALEEIETKFFLKISYVIVDGSKTSPLEKYQSQRIKAGDRYHYSIAAGSVLAKVTRDRIMKKLAKRYPVYSFDKHVGYGTKKHLEAIKIYGPCSIHRKSFAPIRQCSTDFHVEKLKNNTITAIVNGV